MNQGEEESDRWSGGATVQLGAFAPGDFDRGRSRPTEVLWWLAKLAFIQSPFPWPMRFKSGLLRAFGASVGVRLYIRPRVNIHFPWKLDVGNDVWIGEGTTILNLEKVTIEHDVALAHEVYIAAAGHDVRDPRFSYANAPVRISTGSWIATRAYVGPGVHIGKGAVVGACACVTKDVPAESIVVGVPARVIGRRVLRPDGLDGAR
ncbi:putative colanic acid biosynthesis acetyltransferase [Microbacterium sp. NPDC096154]|uniref:putative colanic acid biosynthesis acetyltransferase n=1 Tax=Microbacterium sp. NPDC096154 TaxID=3155549 RepID=UPI003328DDA8